MKKLLFICNQNQNRSKTAEDLFKGKYETKSAGLYNERPVNKNVMDWADVIVVMDEEQRKEIVKRFPNEVIKKQILSLNIKDEYSYGQENLKKILSSRFNEVRSII
ncbi:MAG: phosphotyrosine protein phosphatase [Nanoarchaeota archaeon]|nr:phosphotyrosine protein phosphatase [Nanoarchaeota archaeon]